MRRPSEALAHLDRKDVLARALATFAGIAVIQQIIDPRLGHNKGDLHAWLIRAAAAIVLYPTIYLAARWLLHRQPTSKDGRPRMGPS